MISKYLCLIATASAFGTITIEEDGKPKKLYVVGPKKVPTKGKMLKIPHSARSYLATSDKLGPDNWYRPNLVGGSLSYTLNLSKHKCGCNAALYMSLMPGLNEDGSVNPSQAKDFYCDANQVGGVWCPEFDTQEANMYNFISTAHTCDDPNGKGHYKNCDRAGKCQHKAFPTGQYGPGKKINTRKPFTVTQTYTEKEFKVSLSQNGFTLDLPADNCPDGYFEKQAKDLAKGMTFAMSSWGDVKTSMSWLDGVSGCKEACNNNPTMGISNIKIKTGKKSMLQQLKSWVSVANFMQN